MEGGGGGGVWGLGNRDGSVLAVVGVVLRLPRGDLGQPLTGAPQLPRDLARAHLRRVEEEEEEEGVREGRREGG